MTNAHVEGLEPRTFLSAVPAPMLFNAGVELDRLQVRVDLLKFKADIYLRGMKLDMDYRAIHHATAKGDASLEAPFTQLRSDYKTMRGQLAQDRLAESADALKDESVIKLDILQIKKDKGNSSAETADHAKLRSDRVQLQSDLIAGLDSRIATRQSFESTISNDTQAIVTAANNDAAASAALKADVSEFAADRVALLDRLTSDLQTLVTARQKLANDLTAAQSA